ncbi:putative 2-dehydropantoate 2-reductase [Seiridium cardinale]|uniref:2-dehydropantoate 2-reductase n=1 Tax=Seiridium cardinale TaxID=138064 RepID=A0ABR2Y9H2_9PEZI
MLSNKLAVGTLSLGQHESHMLHQKIRSAVQHVISGVEVVHKDPETYAKSQDLSMSAGAKAIRKLCAEVGLEILALAPFENFEGDKSQLDQRLNRAYRRSIQLTALREAADRLYCLRTDVLVDPCVHRQSALRVLEAVNRSNFGLCLDSFHILTKLWSSPHEVSGKYPDADADPADSLHGFERNFPVEKLFHVQLPDGEKFDPWYLEGEAPKFTCYKIDEATRRARPSWAKLLRDVESPQSTSNFVPPDEDSYCINNFHDLYPGGQSYSDVYNSHPLSFLPFDGTIACPIGYQAVAGTTAGPFPDNLVSAQEFDFSFPQFPSAPQVIHNWNTPNQLYGDPWFSTCGAHTTESVLPPEATISSQHVDFSFSQFYPVPKLLETRSTPNQTDFDAWFDVPSLAFPGISYQPIPPNESTASTQQFDLSLPRWPSDPQPLHIWSLPSESDWDDWFAEPLLTFPVPFIEPLPQLPLDSIASSLNGTQVAISDESLGNFPEPLSAIGQEQLAATRTSGRSRKKMKQQKGTYPREGCKCLMGCIDKTFATERDLSRHYYKTGIHPTINQHGCFICRCGKKSLRKDNHVRHVRTCKPVRGSGYSCAKCGDMTPDKQGHLDHLAGCVDTRGRKPRERGDMRPLYFVHQNFYLAFKATYRPTFNADHRDPYFAYPVAETSHKIYPRPYLDTYGGSAHVSPSHGNAPKSQITHRGSFTQETPMASLKARVLIVGTGGVGAMAAYALEIGGKAEVTAVLRSNFTAVQERGFNIDSIEHGHEINGWRPTDIRTTIPDVVKENLQPFDFVLVTTKNIADIPPSVSDLIKPAVTPGTTAIVLSQNGLNIEKPLILNFPTNPIISSISMISATEIGHGNILHDDRDIQEIGPFQSASVPSDIAASAARRYVEVYNGCGKLNIKYEEDVLRSRWRKLVYNASYNTVAAIIRMDTGRMRTSRHIIDDLVLPIMLEIMAVAKAVGVDLPPEVADHFIRVDPIKNEFKPSMCQDIEKGNFIEFETIVGEPLREAEARNVPVPVLKTINKIGNPVRIGRTDPPTITTVIIVILRIGSADTLAALAFEVVTGSASVPARPAVVVVVPVKGQALTVAESIAVRAIHTTSIRGRALEGSGSEMANCKVVELGFETAVLVMTILHGPALTVIVTEVMVVAASTEVQLWNPRRSRPRTTTIGSHSPSARAWFRDQVRGGIRYSWYRTIRVRTYAALKAGYCRKTTMSEAQTSFVEIPFCLRCCYRTFFGDY